MNATTRAIIAGLSFLLVFVSGIWLSRTGRPLNMALSTVHKLISLVAAGFLLVTIYRTSQVATLTGIEVVAVVVAGLLFLGAGISGAFLSSDKPVPAAILRVHQILPVLTVLSSAVTIYHLSSR